MYNNHINNVTISFIDRIEGWKFLRRFEEKKIITKCDSINNNHVVSILITLKTKIYINIYK